MRQALTKINNNRKHCYCILFQMHVKHNFLGTLVCQEYWKVNFNSKYAICKSWLRKQIINANLQLAKRAKKEKNREYTDVAIVAIAHLQLDLAFAICCRDAFTATHLPLIIIVWTLQIVNYKLQKVEWAFRNSALQCMNI